MSALKRPQPRPGVLAIDPYVPGKSTAPGVARVFKRSSNEQPVGPSPKGIAAYKAAAEHLEDYPDGASTALREAIGRAFGLDPGRIVCGAGSDRLLNLIADAYLCDGDEAIHTTHGFLVYPIAPLRSGAQPIVAAETNYTADVDAILAAGRAAVQDRARVEAPRAHNEKWLAWLTTEIRQLGLEVTPTIAHFVLIHFPDTKGRTAEEAAAFLTQRGLILRRVGAYKLPNALRMSVGSEEANRLVVSALAEFLSAKDLGRR